MPTKNGIGPVELKPDQLRLLNELALFSGVQIVRHRRDHVHYEALEQKSFIEATELSKKEIRYNITLSGRTVLTSYP
jgi:hypothetical protein